MQNQNEKSLAMNKILQSHFDASIQHISLQGKSNFVLKRMFPIKKKPHSLNQTCAMSIPSYKEQQSQGTEQQLEPHVSVRTQGPKTTCRGIAEEQIFALQSSPLGRSHPIAARRPLSIR